MVNENPSFIARASAPSLLDANPYLALCEVNDGTAWIQISKDESLPNWVKFDNLELANKFKFDLLFNNT